MIKVFISYAKEDCEIAYRIYSDLKMNGINPWIDSECILPGEKWKVSITKAIKESKFFIAILSSTSVSKKGFVQKELLQAFDVLDLYPENDIFIIPVRINACKPSHTKLEEIHWVDFFPSYENGLNKILTLLDSSGSLIQRHESTNRKVNKERQEFYNEFNSLTYEIHSLANKQINLIQSKSVSMLNILKHPITAEIKLKNEKLQNMFYEMTLSDPSDICKAAQEIVKIIIMIQAYALAMNKDNIAEQHKKLITYRDLYIKAVRREIGLDDYRILSEKA